MSSEDIPDVRDGLTRKERIVLHALNQIQQERGEGHVRTTLLWGRVSEYEYMSPEEIMVILARLGANRFK